MAAGDDELIARARAMRQRAWAPYSRFTVGAAARAKDGRVYAGANVENASYPLSVCAERVALMNGVVDGATRFEAIAIATSASPPASPCGGCRQVLAEFADDAMRILLVGEEGPPVETTLGALLPRAFRSEALP